MFTGYLKIGDTEVVNASRTSTYVNALTGVTIKNCVGCADLGTALANGPYVDPTDPAPWYDANNAATAEFLGLHALTIDGLESGSQTAKEVDLAHGGATHETPYAGPRNIRVRGIMFATTDEGLHAGYVWLRSVLNGDCDSLEDCDGWAVTVYSSCPETTAQETSYRRELYEVAVADPLSVSQPLPSKSCVAEVVEFALSVGAVGTFTQPKHSTTTTGVTATAANEVACSTAVDPYDTLVVDPNDPLAVPPVPPQIEPYTPPASWSRRQMLIPPAASSGGGVLVPEVTIASGTSARRNVRIRLYPNPDGLTGIDVPECDFIGEFYLTYMPANATLKIAGPTRRIAITLADGNTYPATHLVTGSYGRPSTWPELGCAQPYLQVVDSEVTLGDAIVLTNWVLRE